MCHLYIKDLVIMKKRIIKKHINYVTNYVPYYIDYETLCKYINVNKYYRYCIKQNHKVIHNNYFTKYYEKRNNKIIKFSNKNYKLL